MVNDTQTQPAQREKQESKKRGWLTVLYPAVWRWHFWAGLLVTPVLIIVAATGALYVFEDDINVALHSEVYTVTPPADLQRAPLNDRIDAASQAMGEGFEFGGLYRHDDPSRSDEFYFDQDAPDHPEGHIHYNVFVNPYTSKVLGQRNSETGFFPVVLRLHRTLLAGSWGRYFVELATCWGIVSMLTGILLWCRRKKGMKAGGIWVPRLNLGFKKMLRDLHAIPGVYMAVFIIAVMFTGLLFTQVWGKAALAGLAVSGQAPAEYLSPPQSGDLSEGAAPIDAQAALAEARTHYPYNGYYLAAPHSAKAPWVIYGRTQEGDLDDGVVYVDQADGKTLGVIDFPSLGIFAKAYLTFYSIHVGSIFGLTSKILAVLSCLLLIFMSLTGVWMWWRRRPQGKFGVPKHGKDERVPMPIVITILFLAILFPLVGATLLLFALIGGLRWGIRKVRA